MKKFKNSFFYIGITGGFTILICWLLSIGKKLEQSRTISIPTSEKSEWQEFTEVFAHNLQHPLAMLLVQILTIILAARALGWLCRKIGQPAVIGEIVAGIMLGPS